MNNVTPFMLADEMALGFNSVTERKYWKARVTGKRDKPTVTFSSQASMVCLIYNPASDQWTVTFSKVSCAFGDFMASTYNSLMQILLCLKASGASVEAPLDATDGVLRLQYDPALKETRVKFARLSDDWLAFDDDPFKVSENNTLPSTI